MHRVHRNTGLHLHLGTGDTFYENLIGGAIESGGGLSPGFAGVKQHHISDLTVHAQGIVAIGHGQHGGCIEFHSVALAAAPLLQVHHFDAAELRQA